MPIIKRFEELECWQQARVLVQVTYSLTKKDAFSKDYRLVSQITASAVSSMANIAEGFHRSSNKDFMKFLDYARSSIAETISHTYVALDQEYITSDDMNELKQQADLTWKQINSFISYLSRR